MAEVILEKSHILSHIYVMILIVLGFVIFNAADMGTGIGQIKAMFGFDNLPLISKEAVYYLRSYGTILVMAVAGATPIVKNAYLAVRGRLKTFTNVLETILLVLAVLVMTAYFVDGSFNPFLYFRF